MGVVSRYETLLERVQREDPAFQVVDRDQSWLAPIMTLWTKLARRNSSLDGFNTTIGSTMYTGQDFKTDTDEQRYRSLRHEVTHSRQAARWPLGPSEPRTLRRYANLVLWGMFYLLSRRHRARWEREGYEQTILCYIEDHGDVPGYWEDWMVRTFTGSTYAWMWPDEQAVRAWFQDTVSAAKSGQLRNDQDFVDPSLTDTAR